MNHTASRVVNYVHVHNKKKSATYSYLTPFFPWFRLVSCNKKDKITESAGTTHSV